MEEDCRIRPMINMLDSSTGGTAVRTEQRLKIGERLVGLLSSRENARKEFLSARGVEAALNALDEYDSKELALICVRLLTELVEHGYARRIVQCNGTCILFNLISRCLAEERHVHQYGDLVKAVLVLLALIKPKDKGFCLRCQNTDGVAVLLKLARENSKIKLPSLNLLKLVASNSNCAREIVPSLTTLLNQCTVQSGRRNTGHVRSILQIITKTVKSSNANCAKTTHLIATVVEQIESWHNYDRKQGGRLIQIRKAFLTLLSTMASVKQNRVKIGEVELMQKLFRICDKMVRKNAPDELTKLLINTMHKSLPLVNASESDIDVLQGDSRFKKQDDEVPPISEQFPDLKVFDCFFPELRLPNEQDSESVPVPACGAPSILPFPTSAKSQNVLNLPKLIIKRRRSTTNLPQSVKNATSISLPNLVFPKPANGKHRESGPVGKSLTIETPQVSPRQQPLQQSPNNKSLQLQNCIKCMRSKSCLTQEQNPQESQESPREQITKPTAHNAKFQSEIEIESSHTHTVDRYGDKRSADVVNVLPGCEVFGQMSSQPVPQLKTKVAVRQRRLLRDVERYAFAETFVNKCIYAPREGIREQSAELGQLSFESRFESGNLSEAYLAKDSEYDLYMEPDLFQDNHRQWFFFKVSNISNEEVYTFNILNFEKKDSQFGKGMQPLVFSMTEATQGYPQWKRAGSDIVYYKNNIKNRYSKTHYTLSFDMRFEHRDDSVFIAYHFPYTYTRLRAELARINVSGFIFHRQTMCETILENKVDLLTVTAPDDDENPLRNREYVVISSRVHPGETNASWVMRGIIRYLTSDSQRAENLRRQFIFKLVPMLNPDGCIIGNHRTNMAKFDLNRQWEIPNQGLSPSVFTLKGIIANLVDRNRAPFCYVDLHGHSIKKNSFLFGCEGSTEVFALPRLMNSLPMFSMMNCRFQLTRERCARTVVYRRLGVLRSYTLESTYNGCDQGPLYGMQITETELAELGVGLLGQILTLRRQILTGRTAADSDTLDANRNTHDSDQNSDSAAESDEY